MWGYERLSAIHYHAGAFGCTVSFMVAVRGTPSGVPGNVHSSIPGRLTLAQLPPICLAAKSGSSLCN
ncbi:hypothetical protein EMIT048CA2_20429 [Pseudomonas chlororaphis]